LEIKDLTKNAIDKIKELLHLPKLHNGDVVLFECEVASETVSCDVIVTHSSSSSFDLNVYVLNQDSIKYSLYRDKTFMESLRLQLNVFGFPIKDEIWGAESGMQTKDKVVIELSLKQGLIFKVSAKRKGLVLKKNFI
jgi:hypothetical protein